MHLSPSALVSKSSFPGFWLLTGSSLQHISFTFNFLTEENTCFLCVTSKEFEHRVAFAFLKQIQKDFLQNFGSKQGTDGFRRYLALQMVGFDEVPAFLPPVLLGLMWKISFFNKRKCIVPAMKWIKLEA